MLPTLLFLLQAAASVPGPATAWMPRMREDKTAGTKSVSVGVVSREGNARLVVRCDSGAEQVVSVQFVSKTALGASDDRAVSVTADTGQPLDFDWEFPGTGAFTRDGQPVTALTVAFATAHTIKLHTTDINNAAVDATFDGPPSDAVIRQVLDACGYQFGVAPAPKPSPTPKKVD